MACDIAYYVPTIPNVWSTDRYQHALGLMSTSDSGIIFTNESVPDEIGCAASKVHTISGGGLREAKKVAELANQYVSDNGTFVTSYHYEPALSGFLAQRKGLRWVADIYETPAQYRLNNPYSHHQLSSRLLEQILSKSDRSVHSFHPETPYQYGSDRRFLTNGAPTTKVSPKYVTSNPIRIVWAGSPRMDRGGRYLVKSLSEPSLKCQVDVYGNADEELKRFVGRQGVSDSIVFHGWSDHEQVLAAIRDATVGYGVLPPRTDWRYAPAIKIGEYLAGGTIPLVSTFPGSRYVAGEAGYYVDPSADSVRTSLSAIEETSSSNLRYLMREARHHAESISWEKIRNQFVSLVLEK